MQSEQELRLASAPWHRVSEGQNALAGGIWVPVYCCTCRKLSGILCIEATGKIQYQCAHCTLKTVKRRKSG